MAEPDHGADPRGIAGTYQRQAAAWDQARSRIYFEKPWIDRALQGVPQGGAVLDLGCGAGDPIGCDLVARGMQVTALDIAPAMAALYAARCPGAEVLVGDMTELALTRRFDAVIGWDSFFHLTPAAQRATLPRLLQHLNPGGRLLVTVGDRACEVTGSVGGEPVYHASLSEAEYRAILWINRARVVDISLRDPSCDFHSILLAQRSG